MMRAAQAILCAGLIAATVSGCSGDDATEALELELAQVTAERDALAAQLETQTGRRDRALEITDEIAEILADPESFGTEEEVADLLGTHATEAAVMDDAVFGAVNYRDGFYNTLYSDAIDARIDVYETWVSEDGTIGGALWVWYGVNAKGNPFELAGISLTEHADDGRISYELVTYPYPGEYVWEAVFGAGTPTPSTG